MQGFSCLQKNFTIVPFIKPHREGVGLIDTSYSGDFYCLFRHNTDSKHPGSIVMQSYNWFVRNSCESFLDIGLHLFFPASHLFYSQEHFYNEEAWLVFSVWWFILKIQAYLYEHTGMCACTHTHTSPILIKETSLPRVCVWYWHLAPYNKLYWQALLDYSTKLE